MDHIISMPNGDIRVYDEMEKQIGIINVSHFDTIPNWKWTLLSDLYVDESRRNEGIATMLIQKGLEAGTKRGNGIYLIVLPDNEDAIRLYKKLGFSVFKEVVDEGTKDMPYHNVYYVMTHGGEKYLDQLNSRNLLFF